MTPLALPCKLMIPTKGRPPNVVHHQNLWEKSDVSNRAINHLLSSADPNEEALELVTPTDPVVELLKQGAGE